MIFDCPDVEGTKLYGFCPDVEDIKNYGNTTRRRAENGERNKEMKTREVKDLLKDPFFTYAALIFEDGDGDGDGEDGDSDGDDGEEKKYTQSEVNAMISERLKRERAKSKAHEDEAAKLARMSESEKQAKALKDLQDRLDAFEAKEVREPKTRTWP